jgi:NAD(P)-dependent dehydrogenase (short-subunit alcohol dehydrogenase family)
MSRHEPATARPAAIVTGGARGIGFAIAQRLIRDGYYVALWDVDRDGVMAAARDLGDHCAASPVDVTQSEHIKSALKTLTESGRPIRALVNNAGILGPVKKLIDLDEADYHIVMDVNLRSQFLVCKAVIPVMLAQTGPVRGRIVNMSSVQGKEGMSLSGAYGISKAGVLALTKILGKEHASDGILVNSITPTAVETAMATLLTPERRQDIVSRIPMGRFIEADEVAALVSFLCSDQCTFSTGAAFDLSGGRLNA